MGKWLMGGGTEAEKQGLAPGAEDEGDADAGGEEIGEPGGPEGGDAALFREVLAR